MRDPNVGDDVIEELMAKAKQHGEDSEPDHEVGDLQDLLRLLWRHANPHCRRYFLDDPKMEDIREMWL